MEAKRTNRTILYVFGVIFTVVAIANLFMAHSFGTNHEYGFSVIMAALGVSLFLPPPEKLSVWMYIRFALVFIAVFFLGYFWR